MPDGYLVISDLSGGLNTTDSPFSLPANKVTQVENVEWVQTTVARKRRGVSTPLDVSAVGGQPTAMFRHTPTNSERTAELWLFANNPSPQNNP